MRKADAVGLFRRNKDEQGFYRGDAPASAPGLDGAAPTAYTGQPTASSATYGAATSASYGVAPGADDSAVPGASPDAQPTYSQPPYAQPTFTQPLYSQQSPTQTPGAPVSGSVPPYGPANPQLTAALAAMAASPTARAGRGIALIVMLVVLAMVGVGTFLVVSNVKDAVSGRGPGATAPGPADSAHGTATTLPDRTLGRTELGDTVTINTSDGVFQIVVFDAVAQPGDSFEYAVAADRPKLVVDAQITRVDGGLEPVRFLGWNWSIIDTDGDRVTGDIITRYYPGLVGPELVGGQTMRGFVTFDTAATTTSLTVAAGPIEPGQATWNIVARTPAEVHAAIGDAVQAEISRPPFTVTVGAPEVRAEGSEGVKGSPVSGQYVVFPVEFTPSEGTSGHLGTVGAESFVFVPDGAPASYPVNFAVYESFSFVSIDAPDGASGALAFDTAATRGTLQLRDGADRTIASWEITVG